MSVEKLGSALNVFHKSKRWVQNAHVRISHKLSQSIISEDSLIKSTVAHGETHSLQNEYDPTVNTERAFLKRAKVKNDAGVKQVLRR